MKRFFLALLFFPVLLSAQSKIKLDTQIKPGTVNSVAITDASGNAIWSPFAIFVSLLGYIDTVVFVIDGQSNSIGQQSQSSKTYAQSNLKIWNGTTWIDPQTGVVPFNLNGANNIGLQFALRHAKLHPRTLVRLIVSGNSGQPISYWLTSPYIGFVSTDNLIKNAIGTTKTVDAFVWVQGESDYTRTAAQYESDFYALRNGGWLTTTWYKPSTKHICVGLYTGVGNGLGFQDETLKKIGSDSIVQTSYANPYGLMTYDNTHYTNTAIDSLGDIVYNAYLSTPYTYSNKTLKRLTESSNSELSVYDSGKENILYMNDDGGTNDGNVQNTIYMNGRYSSTVPSSKSDAYSDVSISSYKDANDGNGGSGILFKTSSFGAGGLLQKMKLNRDGVLDVLSGFRISGVATNNLFMVGNGSIFSGRYLNNADITGALSSTNRFNFSDANLASLTINGGDGVSGTNGATIIFKKDNLLNFFFGNESAAYGGTTNNGMTYIYGSNAYRVATNATKRFSVEGNGNILIGGMTDNGLGVLQVFGQGYFSSTVQGSDPTAPNHFSTRQYNDNTYASLSTINNYSQTQNFNGVANFFSAVTVPPPTGGANPTPKSYVDAVVENVSWDIDEKIFSVTTNIPTGSPFTTNTAGTGAANAQATRVTGDNFGRITCGTGTTATGRAGITTSPVSIIFETGKTYVFDINRFRIPATLTASASVFLGFGDGTTAEPVDGAYFKINDLTSNITCVTSTNSVRSNSGAGLFTYTVNTNYNLRIVATSTSVSYFINDMITPIFTTTTNIPTAAGREFGLMAIIVASAGTTSQAMQIDDIKVAIR
jgi:Carbohydrate esterase, sialic acid-specific acetylesterase